MFRRRFRVTADQFDEIYATLCDEGWWNGGPDCTGKVLPVRLLLLGALRMLGRACTFDDLEEVTYISPETHRRFFHAFTAGCAAKFHRETEPFLRGDEDVLNRIERLYASNGFPGCVGATDCVHIPRGRCSFAEKSWHVGKEGLVSTFSWHAKLLMHCVSLMLVSLLLQIPDRQLRSDL